SNANEVINLSANGSRLRFTRDVGNIVMDVNAVERVDFNALGGADTITVGDLTGTAVTEVNLNLQATGGLGDGSADTVIVNGTARSEERRVGGAGSGVTVSGLAAKVRITGSEAARDGLNVNALAGADVVDASGLHAGAPALAL